MSTAVTRYGYSRGLPGGRIDKRFDGKKFLLQFQRGSKVEANAEARHLREIGYFVRVVKMPYNKEYPYWIFIRAKR
ncbi:MAG: hypothetical protein PHQ43_09045 [Dehalococcoidales bacterium]|nr:hypothetical protein [Dehalococcoidales bacterium]